MSSSSHCYDGEQHPGRSGQQTGTLAEVNAHDPGCATDERGESSVSAGVEKGVEDVSKGQPDKRDIHDGYHHGVTDPRGVSWRRSRLRE